MSHHPERKDKDCLNCGTIVHGRFCHVCGQENLVTHQNFAALTKHFIYDIFHFDGKFFDTLKYLLLKPGVVAADFVKGKRAKYLDPIRMYLFTSAVFFVVFFGIIKPVVQIGQTDDDIAIPTSARLDLANNFKEQLKANPTDTIISKKIGALNDTTKPITFSELAAIDPPSVFGRNGRRNRSLKEYDSLQQILPKEERDGWLTRRVVIKAIDIDAKYKGDWKKSMNDFVEGFLHRMPYLFFFSIPFFAFILKLLYVRRKAFFYSDHAVFTLYHYIFSFFILLLIFGTVSLINWLKWTWLVWLIAALSLYWLVYLYKSMQTFYRQSRAKTVGKFLLLNLINFLGLILLFLVFIFFSIFQM